MSLVHLKILVNGVSLPISWLGQVYVYKGPFKPISGHVILWKSHKEGLGTVTSAKNERKLKKKQRQSFSEFI